MTSAASATAVHSPAVPLPAPPPPPLSSLLDRILRPVSSLFSEPSSSSSTPSRLGDVWTAAATTARSSTPPDSDLPPLLLDASDDAATNSGEDAKGKDSAAAAATLNFRTDPSVPSVGKLRVAFRNLTDVPLTLCWVDARGKPYHFYDLGPHCGRRKGEGDGNDRGGDRAKLLRMVTKRDHVETTVAGHAFVVARRYRTAPTREVDDGSDGDGAANGGSNAVDGAAVGEGPSSDGDLLLPAPPPSFGIRRPSSCLKDCGSTPPSKTTAPKEEGRRRQLSMYAEGNGGKRLYGADLIGGYRPLRRATPKAGAKGAAKEEEEQERFPVHLVTITRHRRRRGFLRGCWRMPDNGNETDGDDESGEWIYRIDAIPSHLDPTPLDTSDKHYDHVVLGGWPCRVEPGWDSCPDRGAALRSRIESDLKEAFSCLPSHARQKLMQTTPVWINRCQKYGPAASPETGRGMCFHPESEWLDENGMSVKKQHGIELYDGTSYLDDCDLWGPGGIMLHELSHAYHNLCLTDGYDNSDIKTCYDAAAKSGSYDSVPVHGSQGPKAKAYAMDNAMEYFAELSVAYLGGKGKRKDDEHNKWFPFNRSQVLRHDPQAYEMLRKIWREDDDSEEVEEEE